MNFCVWGLGGLLEVQDLNLREMGSKNCMNDACRETTSSEWKKGWSLKSGGFAKLCYRCG